MGRLLGVFTGIGMLILVGLLLANASGTVSIVNSLSGIMNSTIYNLKH